MNDRHEHAEFSEHAAKNRRIWEASAGWAGVLRQYSIGVVWGSFLKRCPFLALSVQQAAAKRQQRAAQSESRKSFDFRWKAFADRFARRSRDLNFEP
jgi:hypothetical protein